MRAKAFQSVRRCLHDAPGQIKKKSVEGECERILRVGHLASSIASAEVVYDLDKCAVRRFNDLHCRAVLGSPGKHARINRTRIDVGIDPSIASTLRYSLAAISLFTSRRPHVNFLHWSIIF